MRIFKIALLVVFAAATTLGTASSAPPADTSAIPTSGLRPAMDFWPLRPGDEQSWWRYSWTNGPNNTLCNSSAKELYIAADRLDDGAFDPLSNGTDLISFNFFKSDKCIYPGVGSDTLLRWYSRGFVNSSTRINDTVNAGNFSQKFLSFRGASFWETDRSGSTRFGQADGTTRSVNGRFAVNLNRRFTYVDGFKFSYTDRNNPTLDTPLDDRQVPNYMVLPDRSLHADVILTRQGDRTPSNIDSAPLYFRYNPDRFLKDIPEVNDRRIAAWNEMRHSLNTGGVAARWAMYMRPTSFKWEGKEVLYVGFSETNESNPPGGVGACEEWWFAQDIGPVYIAVYPDATPQQCRNGYLAVDKEVFTGVAVVPAIDNPELYFGSGAASALIGYVKQTERCVHTSNCKVTY